MTSDVKKFKELDHSIAGKVRFDDGSTVAIQGKGTVLFQCESGEQWLLLGVYFIPKFHSNLVSLSQLTECGHRIMMDETVLELLRKIQ